MKDKLQRVKIYLIPTFFGAIFVLIISYLVFINFRKEKLGAPTKLPEVTLPTIGPGGDLILTQASVSGKTGKSIVPSKLGVVSANLAAIFDKEKMTGVRILGEVVNLGEDYIDSVDPVVRFYDTNQVMISQKIARFSQGFDFKEVSPKDKVVYDVTINNPPTSDRLEIVFNVVSSTDSAKFLSLKIASRSMELKTTEVQSQESSGSAQNIDYYTVSGKVVNTYENLLSDITIYAWGKDISGKVFVFGRADFKNDLLNPSDKVDFKIIMLPIQANQKLESYEIFAWGKEYHLLTSSPN